MKYSEFIKEIIAQMRETAEKDSRVYFICLAITDVNCKTGYLYKEHARKLKKAVKKRIEKQKKDFPDHAIAPSTLCYISHYYSKKKGLSLSDLEARIYWLESLVKYHSSRGN